MAAEPTAVQVESMQRLMALGLVEVVGQEELERYNIVVAQATPVQVISLIMSMVEEAEAEQEMQETVYQVLAIAWPEEEHLLAARGVLREAGGLVERGMGLMIKRREMAAQEVQDKS